VVGKINSRSIHKFPAINQELNGKFQAPLFFLDAYVIDYIKVVIFKVANLQTFCFQFSKKNHPFG